MNTRSESASGRSKQDERSSPKALDFDTYVPAYLTLLANKISAGASALYRPAFGIGITDWRIMALLAVEPWIAAGRICDVTGLDKAAVSRSVQQLAKRGMVELRADAADQRRQLLALTRAGLALHDRIVDVSRERERQLLALLSETDRKMLIDFLMRMKAQVGAANAVGSIRKA
jgi:DNA-binding MarR family transcriptional regulator